MNYNGHAQPLPPRPPKDRWDRFYNPARIWRQLAVGSVFAVVGSMVGLILSVFATQSAMYLLAPMGIVAGFFTGFYIERQ